MEVQVVALVLDVDQFAQQPPQAVLLADRERHAQPRVVLRRAEAVDARDAGHDEHVPALQQRAGGAVPQLVDVVVDRRVLLDVGVGLREVGLGLIVVVVGDEVLDGVVGEKPLELVEELRREGLVVGDDQGRPLQALDDVGDGEGLARPGDAEQHLGGAALLDAADEGLDAAPLVPLRAEGRDETEAGHEGLLAAHPGAEVLVGAQQTVVGEALDPQDLARARDGWARRAPSGWSSRSSSTGAGPRSNSRRSGAGCPRIGSCARRSDPRSGPGRERGTAGTPRPRRQRTSTFVSFRRPPWPTSSDDARQLSIRAERPAGQRRSLTSAGRCVVSRA